MAAAGRERYGLLHEGRKVEQEPEILWSAARRCMTGLAGKCGGDAGEEGFGA